MTEFWDTNAKVLNLKPEDDIVKGCVITRGGAVVNETIKAVLLIIITGVMEHAEDYRNSMWMLHAFVLAVLSYLILNGLLAVRPRPDRWKTRDGHCDRHNVDR